ncbi:GNAT family N-acetyltransferase [Kitasatospora sp. NPDC005856]|uniref:GNAT family N-acetyltransferase n=1 Tax=Kitasatospora sp. NPDC005856 TaxID=3154566 RepID=UPI0033E45215
MIAQSHDLPRSATTVDIEELVRLRGHLLGAGTAPYAARTPQEDAAWRAAYRSWLVRQLTGPTGRVHVTVIGPAHRLAACAVAVIDDRAPTAHCLNGLTGWVQSVVVDPDRRRSGLGTRVMRHALDWLRSRGVDSAVLQTTPDGAALYRGLGFLPTGEDLLALDLRGTETSCEVIEA